MSLQTKMSCPRFSMATLIAQTDSVIDKWGPQAKQRFMIEAVVIAMSELGCKQKP